MGELNGQTLVAIRLPNPVTAAAARSDSFGGSISIFYFCVDSHT